MEYEKEQEKRQKKENQKAREDNVEKLHRQFLYFWKGALERTKQQPDWEKIKELYTNALVLTAPDYQRKLEQKEILSNMEIRCITEIIDCNRNVSEKEKEFKKLYAYFLWNREREGLFPPPYRIAMQYYAECLYENKKYDMCIQICSEAIEEFFHTSKVGNRMEVFLQRAKAREKKGIQTEEDKRLCLKDFMIAYHGFLLYGQQEEAEKVKKHVEEVYKWRSIESGKWC